MEKVNESKKNQSKIEENIIEEKKSQRRKKPIATMKVTSTTNINSFRPKYQVKTQQLNDLKKNNGNNLEKKKKTFTQKKIFNKITQKKKVILIHNYNKIL